MLPLSCVNCCHNPLQLGSIGPSFGHCTRHRQVLVRPHLTTCGQLLRKDLLARRAAEERALHAQTFREDRVSVLASPKTEARRAGMTEAPNGQPSDVVVDEVRAYGEIDSKIATMAALRRVPGPRAEVALLSLSRAYVANCYAQGGQWTAGVHLAAWTLERLATRPEFSATDLRGPFASHIDQVIAIATWTLVTFRLALLTDVAEQAVREGDSTMGRIPHLVPKVIEVPPTRPDQLLALLDRGRAQWAAALPAPKYARIKAALHKDEPS